MQNEFARIVIDITSSDLDRIFEYRIPEELKGKLMPGMVVEVPFGKGDRVVTGYVTGLSEKSSYDPSKIKPILRIRSDASGSENKLVALAAAMKERYGCTFSQALRVVFPVKKKVRATEKKTVYLAASREEAEQALAVMKKKNQKARARLLEALILQPSLPLSLVREKLGVSAETVRYLEEQGLASTSSETVLRRPSLPGEAAADTEKEPPLTNEQRLVVETVVAGAQKDGEENGRYLLQGVTGSGKTRVYMDLIEYEVKKGRQAIMLIPEIALTWQTMLRFYRRFGDRVSFIHSRLSEGERYDQFLAARDGKIDVMIGPRSALFTPFPDLGIIVVDEEHENAYQSEKMPCYHAREVARMRADMEKALLVLGSATPSIEASFEARTGSMTLLKLN